MKQTLSNMAAQYQAELDDYKLRFFTKWGYRPIDPTQRDFRFLNDKKQRMCQAFWNHMDVNKCIALIELLSMSYADCKLQTEGK